jgi:3-hydroxyisobutyrate dehydrogenase
VAVWNRTSEKAEPLTADGARAAAAAEEAAAGVDLLVTMLADGPAIEAVLGGADDPLAALADDAIWLQMSTVGPAATSRLAALAADRGVTFVDAPVLGSYDLAVEGELIVLASGPDDARDRCTPVFDAVGARTLWLGPAGAGSRLKVVVNAWLMSTNVALAETITLAEDLGLDPESFLEVIGRGTMGVEYTELNGPAMIARDFPLNFPLALATKDAALALESAADPARLKVLNATRDQYARGEELGHGARDWAAVVCAAAAERAS